MCFDPDADRLDVAEDWAVYLAPAAVTSPEEGDLIRVHGTWSERDGAVLFDFAVPSLEAGKYRGYIACPDGRLDPSTRTLLITGGVPATNAAPAGRRGSAGAPWWVVVVAGLGGFAAAFRRFGASAAARAE